MTSLTGEDLRPWTREQVGLPRCRRRRQGQRAVLQAVLEDALEGLGRGLAVVQGPGAGQLQPPIAELVGEPEGRLHRAQAIQRPLAEQLLDQGCGRLADPSGLEPVLADRLPGVADKCFGGNQSQPTSGGQLGLFASPNPFNPKTTIEFNVPSGGRGEVKIFDIRGYLVATLYDGPLVRGQNTFVWEGRNSSGSPVASGVYLVSAQTDGHEMTRKLLLVK